MRYHRRGNVVRAWFLPEFVSNCRVLDNLACSDSIALGVLRYGQLALATKPANWEVDFKPAKASTFLSELCINIQVCFQNIFRERGLDFVLFFRAASHVFMGRTSYSDAARVWPCDCLCSRIGACPSEHLFPKSFKAISRSVWLQLHRGSSGHRRGSGTTCGVLVIMFAHISSPKWDSGSIKDVRRATYSCLLVKWHSLLDGLHSQIRHTTESRK